MPPDPNDQAKRQLRATLRARLQVLDPSARDAAATVICRQLADLTQLAAARTVLGYAAMANEVDIDPFLGALITRGVGVFLPRVEGDHLRIARVTDLGQTVAGWRGIREPPPSNQRPARTDRLDAVLVPGLGFDANGNRLGRGGGHYDRLLASVRPGTLLVGVAFAQQLVTAVPVSPHDRPVDLVVTDQVLRHT